MKKLLSLALVLVMLLSFAACNSLKAEDVLGTLDGRHYKNTALGMQIFAPAGWEYSSAEEIKALGGAEDLEDADVAVYDMMLVNTQSGSNIIVGFENMGNIYGSVISEDEYLELSTKHIEKSEDGYEVVSIETDTVEIADQTLKCLKVEQTYGTTSIHQIIAVKKCENFMGIISITSFSDDMDDIIDMIGKASE